MQTEQAIQLFKCLADATRLELVRALADGPKYGELLAERLGRTPSTISFHLKKLEEAGLISGQKEQYYTIYTLEPNRLDTTLRALIAMPEAQADVQAEREARYRRKVLDTFFRYGKLTSIPVQRKKRLIVLEKLAERFERDRVYTEKEVNLLIAEANDDFCTLRRELITEGLMTRDHGQYQLAEEKPKD